MVRLLTIKKKSNRDIDTNNILLIALSMGIATNLLQPLGYWLPIP